MSIGATLAEARQEAGLTVADVSARTRIREGLIRAIEQDEFASCGGDFYARGHIRAIAGVVGTDPRPLIVEYDAAHTPAEGYAALPASGLWARQPAAERPAADDLTSPPGRPPRRRGRFGWLVPLVMLACLVSIVAIAYRLTGAKGGSQPPGAASSHHAAARAATSSPGQRSRPRARHQSAGATPPAAASGTPVTEVTPVGAAAFGPAGTSDGDNPQNASFALSGNPATPWRTDWYTTARFGNLKTGTGLLVDLGRTVTATAVNIHLASAPGADLKVLGGTTASDLHAVARAANADGAVRLRLASQPHLRYMLIWFTLLPPDAEGTYQAAISGVTVAALAR
jgi:cytoskeletal protein RodZ